MHYRRWTTADGPLGHGLAEEWTEIDDAGRVTRELGFDRTGNIIHQAPSRYFPQGTYGHFDLAPVETTGEYDRVDPAEFEQKWERATRETAGLTRDSSLVRLVNAVKGLFR